jgi:hypothetical protein
VSLLTTPGEATPAQVRLLDVATAIWLLGWLGIGIFVGVDVHHLGQLATTIDRAGHALQATGGTLGAFGHVPLIGGQLSRLATQLQVTAGNTIANAATAKTSVDQLSYLLGVVIVVLPWIPALALYLPFRMGRAREARAVRAAMESGDDPRQIERYLAERALLRLSYDRLREISADPWRDVAEGRVSDLAAAELVRVGVNREAVRRGRDSYRRR